MLILVMRSNFEDLQLVALSFFVPDMPYHLASAEVVEFLISAEAVQFLACTVQTNCMEMQTC